MLATAKAGTTLDTFPKYLLLNADRFGDRPAMRHKDLGIWQGWTWKQQLEEVRAFAIGLSAALAVAILIPAAVISAPKEEKGKPAIDAKAREQGESIDTGKARASA